MNPCFRILAIKTLMFQSLEAFEKTLNTVNNGSYLNYNQTYRSRSAPATGRKPEKRERKRVRLFAFCLWIRVSIIMLFNCLSFFPSFCSTSNRNTTLLLILRIVHPMLCWVDGRRYIWILINGIQRPMAVEDMDN